MAARDTERYYWLKLDRGFFKRHDIAVIENMPNGKEYVLLYLKLMCESVDHEGALRFSDAVPYTEEMLSSVTHMDPAIVRSAMDLFKTLGMIEMFDDDTIFIPMVADLLDSETYSAKRKRENRQNVTIAENVPQLSPDCPQFSGNCPQEKEKELEIELELESDSEIDKTVGTEPTPAPVLTIPLNDGSEWPVTEDFVQEMQKLYPAVDVMQELRSMRAWSLSNPARRKTRRGVKSFINRWLSSEQDKGGRLAQQSKQRQYTTAEEYRQKPLPSLSPSDMQKLVDRI